MAGGGSTCATNRLARFFWRLLLRASGFTCSLTRRRTAFVQRGLALAHLPSEVDDPLAAGRRVRSIPLTHGFSTSALVRPFGLAGRRKPFARMIARNVERHRS